MLVAFYMHFDGTAARCEPGLISDVRSYLGIVEPQMRMTEHMHMLIQVLGFENPRDFHKHLDSHFLIDNSQRA